LIVGLAVVWMLQDSPQQVYAQLWRDITHAPARLLREGSWAFAMIAIVGAFGARAAWISRFPAAFLIGTLAAVQYSTFIAIKTSLVEIVPFYADPYLARADAFLHFGYAPWEITHVFQGYIADGVASFIYVAVWLAFGSVFPALLVLVDDNVARVRRFLVLSFWCWIGLGNILALVFMSCGPVFYDRVYGGETFAPLLVAMDTAGTLDGTVGWISSFLWDNYENGQQSLGAGISAFPSVHVGVATVVALYIYERFPRLLFLSVVIVLTYQFLSVYLGWHYALDGYISILCVIALWRFQLWRAHKLARLT
jgi:hypothetical protein